MSESSSEKTEEPTYKKIQDARKKGQVANSRDTVSTALLIAIFSYVWLGWDFMLRQLKEMLLLPTRFYGAHFHDALANLCNGILIELFFLLAPILLVTVLVAIAANFLQIGPLLAFESMELDLNKLNPVNGFKKIFSMKNVFEFLKSCAKVLFLGFLVYKVTKGMIDPLLKLPPCKLNGLIDMIPMLMKQFAVYVMMGYTVVAVIDFFFQRHNHTKSLRMTKDEVKREYKESEGDPLIKGQRKQLHREMAMEDNVQASRKSTVVITNPTHYAVALYYDRSEKRLPIVTGKGKGLLAQRMMRAAEQAGVPIMQNVALARAIYEVPLRQYIPADLIEPVAEVLRWVYQQTKTQA